MSKYTPEQIEEDNRKRELQMDIDYSCVQFGKWIAINYDMSDYEKEWMKYDLSGEHDYYTTEELYQLYKNTLDNNK